MKKIYLFATTLFVVLITSCSSSVSPKDLVQAKLDSIADKNGWTCELSYLSEPYRIDYVEPENNKEIVDEYYGDDVQKYFNHLSLRLCGILDTDFKKESVIEKNMKDAIERDKFIKKYNLVPNYYMIFYRFKMRKEISGDSQEFIGSMHLDSAMTTVKHIEVALHN